MDIYHFNPQNGEYLGTEKADPDPLVPGNYLIPASAVTVAPPVVRDGEMAVWRGDSWEVVDKPAETVPEPTLDDLASLARLKRLELLFSTDWLVMRAIEKGEAVPEKWALYRQALRDLPTQSGFPTEIVWPEAPA